MGFSCALGTDATIAQHIQTVIDRGYVLERMEGQIKYLVPSTLGVGLIEGYNDIGFDKSLSKPQLRRDVSLQCSFKTQFGSISAFADRKKHGGSL